MKKKIKSLVKFSAWFITLCLLGLMGFFFWVRGLYTDYTTPESMDLIVRIIKFAPDLPDDYYSTVQKVYPGILSRQYNGYMLNQLLSDQSELFCPCYRLAQGYQMDMKGSRIRDALARLSLTWELESRLSQRQCFNHYAQHFEFGNGVKGISKASERFFQKELENLSLDEQLELIVIMKNSSLYNRLRRPELIKEKVEEHKVKIAE